VSLYVRLGHVDRAPLPNCGTLLNVLEIQDTTARMQRRHRRGGSHQLHDTIFGGLQQPEAVAGPTFAQTPNLWNVVPVVRLRTDAASSPSWSA